MGEHAVDPFWDVSCFLHARLFREEDLVLGDNKRVKEIKGLPIDKP